MKASKSTLIICCAALVLVWALLASKTFNPKPDLNGDNFYYYIYATSLATGHGYSDLSTPSMGATSNFPPGYPLLMTPLRFITDSVVAQKWLNEVFADRRATYILHDAVFEDEVGCECGGSSCRTVLSAIVALLDHDDERGVVLLCFCFCVLCAGMLLVV